GINHVHPTRKAVGGAQGNTADAVTAQVLLHFARQVNLDALHVRLDAASIVDVRQFTFGEFGVEGRTNDLYDLAVLLSVSSCSCCHFLLQSRAATDDFGQ